MQCENSDPTATRRRLDNPAHGPVASRIDLVEGVAEEVAVALAESCLVDLGRVPEIVPRAMTRAQHD